MASPCDLLILRTPPNGCSGSFLLAQTGGAADPQGRILLALIVLAGLGFVLLVTIVLLLLIGRSRRARLAAEQRRRREALAASAWEEAGRRLDLDEQARREYEDG
jgi:hypothetical protein